MVGLSGGVDSAVAALLLQRQGFDVRAAFMKNWEEEDQHGFCQADRDYQDALAVCESAGIPLSRVNFAKEYRKKVFADFLDEYRRGRTPNPDVLCNREIKFNTFLAFARRQGAVRLATGHYAGLRKEGTRILLTEARDSAKDQTYFLYALGQEQLRQAVFPLSALRKAEVRQLARQNRLAVADKKDSTGICFIGERPFADFIGEYLPDEPGDIVDLAGHRVGAHRGLLFYTLGQRHGLGIGGAREHSGEPWYVAGKDLARNQLLVVQGNDHPLLYATRLQATDLNWVAGVPPGERFVCSIKSRYRQSAVSGTVSLTERGCEVLFAAPQRSLTPGQSVVFYHSDVCLGGGIIDSVEGQWPHV